MPCLLQCTQPGALTRFLDPTGDDYVPCICTGAPVQVTCMIYPYLPATQALANTVTVTINGTPIAAQATAQGNAVQVQFTIGNNPSETAPNWNGITITVQDNNNGFTSFTFWFYDASVGGAGTPTPPPTVTPIPTLPPLMAGPGAPRRAPAKKKRS